jgi:pyridoxal 5'-phosphate synthase pdxT subunit
MKIGILAIQGDFHAHAEMLHQLGAETVEVRTVADLQGCDGLILPGGESTTQLQFLEEEGLYDAIQKFANNDGAIFGTCAGAILLANKVKNPPQGSLKLLDMTVLRNGYGRQLASDVFFGPTTLKSDPLEMVFIRGPIIEEVGPSISILAKHEGSPTLVQKGHILAATFHPELTSDPTVHQHFLDLVSNGSQPKSVTTPNATPQRKPNRQSQRKNVRRKS